MLQEVLASSSLCLPLLHSFNKPLVCHIPIGTAAHPSLPLQQPNYPICSSNFFGWQNALSEFDMFTIKYLAFGLLPLISAFTWLGWSKLRETVEQKPP